MDILHVYRQTVLWDTALHDSCSCSPVNDWPWACLLYTYTHKKLSCKSPEDQRRACESHHSVRRLKSDEKCHRRIALRLPLSCATAPTCLKCILPFPLSFPFPLSHGGGKQSQEVTQGERGNSFPVQLIYSTSEWIVASKTGAGKGRKKKNPFFKTFCMICLIHHPVLLLSGCLSSLLFFLWYLRNTCPRQIPWHVTIHP